MPLNDVSIITPTGDREISLDLMIKFMKAQTFCREGGLIEWVICDDGETDATARAISRHSQSELANLGIVIHHVHFLHDPKWVGPKSLCRNIIGGLERVSASKILIMEDDDCYLPGHVSDMVRRLDSAWACGTVWQKYYHLPSRSYRVYRNRGSALCSTGFCQGLTNAMHVAALECFESGSKGLDARFWMHLVDSDTKIDIFEPRIDQVIGMKGLPGRKGIGVGHRPKKFQPDPMMTVLEDWVGDYIHYYKDIIC